MVNPIIHGTESGQRYFNVNGRKIYIERGVSQKTVTKIYKTLQKSVKPKKAKLMYIPASNKASAVIKQYINTHPITRRRRRNHKRSQSQKNFNHHLMIQIEYQVADLHILRTVVTMILSTKQLKISTKS